MSTGFAALHEDLVYEILCTSPDFTTLGTLIRLSKKHTYSVYLAHKGIILYNVVSNLVGSCLSDVLKFAVGLDVDNSTSAIMDALLTLTKTDSIMIEKVSYTLNRFEALYSQIRKDRRSQESVLTPAESSRLRSAVGAVWRLLYTAGDDLEDFNDDDDEEEDYWTSKVKDALFENSKSELSAIFGVGLFIQQLCLWAERATSQLSFQLYPNNFANLHAQEASNRSLCCPDASSSRYFLETDYYPVSHVEMEWEYFKAGIRQISTEKKYGLDIDALKDATDLILEKRYGIDDTCAKCSQVRGVELFGRSNWHLVRDHLPVHHLSGGLDGNLTGNQHELGLICNYIRRGCHDIPRKLFDWPKFIEENFDLIKEEEGDACAWDKDQWYCKDCMIGFLRSRFRKWWIAKKTEEGIAFNEDCWYGYTCRTQRRLPHAQRLNHLCEPTRGDAVVLPQAPVNPPSPPAAAATTDP